MPPSTWETRLAVLLHYWHMAAGMVGVRAKIAADITAFDLDHTALD